MPTHRQATKARLTLPVSAAVVLAGAILPSTALAMASSELYSTEPHFYGRFEARIRYAPGDGAVSSFFLWKEGSSDAGAYWNELDMEKVGANCEMHTNAYYGKPAAQHTQTNSMSASICADYHTYAFEWTPTYISWFMDGKEFRKETGATATAFAQNATGGMTIHFNLWPGNSSFGGDISKTTLPIHQYISWVQYSAYDNGTFKPEPRQEFDGSSLPTGWAVGNWSSPFNLSTHNPQNVSFVNGIAVMSLTADNATGNPGTPPTDSAAGGSSGTGGSSSTGGTGGGAAGAPGTGGTPSSGGSSGAAGKTGTGGTTSGAGGSVGTGGSVSSSGGATSQAGATATNGGTTGTSQGGNSTSNTGGSSASGAGGASASGGNNATTDSTTPKAGNNGNAGNNGPTGGTSSAGGASANTGSSGGCSMAKAGHSASMATWGLVLGALALVAFRRTRRDGGRARRMASRAWLGLLAALLLAWTRPAEAKAYKGAEVYLLKGVLYGRIEVRMRMIRGSGLVSTFFTYKDGSEKSGSTWEETDIEVLGKNDAKSWQSNLITGSPRKTSEQIYTVSTSLADDYHTYTLEWTPTYVSWQLDGTQVRKTEGGQAAELVNPETLRFNAWSSDSTGWVGELDEGALPAYQFVNWIKYYRYDNGEFTLDWTDDFESFDTTRWGKGNWTFTGNRVDFDPTNAIVKDGMLILAITKEGATGFAGTVPADSGSTNPGTISTPTSHDDSGCAIARVPGKGDSKGALVLFAMGLVAVLVRRRRI